MKGCCLTDWSFKSRVLEICFFATIFLIIQVCYVPSSIYAKCTQESRESAVKAGINPKVVKILCGDPLEEDYVFEVKPSQKSAIPTRAVDPETNINDSEVEGESTMELEFMIPEGPPTCDEEKVARMIARGFSDQLIIGEHQCLGNVADRDCHSIDFTDWSNFGCSTSQETAHKVWKFFR